MQINGERGSTFDGAVDHEGEILKRCITKARYKAAALTFMKKALRRHGSPAAIATDGLRSYSAAMTYLGSEDKQRNSHLPQPSFLATSSH